MIIPAFPFQIIDWTEVPSELKQGISGTATWQVIMAGNVRIRKLVYSPGFMADHWCSKGHIIHCLEGEMKTELADGRIMLLKQGMSYIVGDENEAHRSSTKFGCTLFVVD
ncbi:MAG TPA: DHCW motif cupin fold protein [Flavisolibacter sp.]|nr:DHCW motif cupin fold protein [Flavisolibacter sp.]